MDRLFAPVFCLCLAASLSAADSLPLPTAAVTATSGATPTLGVTPPTAPAPVSPSAAPEAPTAPLANAPAALSATADPNAADEPVVPEEMDDPLAMAEQSNPTDLRPISSSALAKLSAALGPDKDSVWYDPDSGGAVDAGFAGAQRVDAEALYGELAKRLVRDDDKDARAALGLAILSKDPRAKEAKDLAYEDQVAESLIAALEKGDPGAKTQLQALAGKGNRRARQYLGLDPAPPMPVIEGVGAAAPLSPSAGTVAEPLSPTAPTAPGEPQALSPAAKP